MKAILQVGVLLFVLCGLVLLYTITLGYTAVFIAQPNTTVQIDGRAVSSSVHQSKRAIIVTRRDTKPAHSYLISEIGESGHLLVFDCGSWVAPRLPVVLSNHQKPICSSWWLEEPPLTMDSPSGPAVEKLDHVEFRTRRGEVISIAPE